MPPDEVTGHMHGPNGERLEVRMGTKSVAFAAQSLIPILLLVGIFVLLIMRGKETNEKFLRLEGRQDQLLALAQGNEARVREALQTLAARLDALSQMHQRLMRIHDYNTGRPLEEHLPLEATPPDLGLPAKKP